MKILFTGASSFTGYWFAKELSDAGHEVTATLTAKTTEYSGVRSRRVEQLAGLCELVQGVSFGDESFLELLAGDWDLLCHHGAHIPDHKQECFNVSQALSINTRNLTKAVKVLAESGGKNILLTGSYYEAGEGGQEDSPAILVSSLSKTFTTMSFRHHCHEYRLGLGHFVIPNPFGPYENDRPRFTTYLMEQWRKGLSAKVLTPKYIRDNIHVRLLAKAYLKAVGDIPQHDCFKSYRPSGIVDTQEKFAERISEETKMRTGLDCKLVISEQTEIAEPLVRRNTELVDETVMKYSEIELWDSFINYYHPH